MCYEERFKCLDFFWYFLIIEKLLFLSMRTLPLSFEICYQVTDKGYIQERDDNFATMLATICYIAFIVHTAKSRYSIYIFF